MLNLIHEFLDIAASRAPNRAAVLTDEGSITYARLSDVSRSLAGRFHKIGVRRGDRVSILLPNGIQAVAGLMAASRLGAIFSVFDPAIKLYHLKYMLEDSSPSLIFTTRQRRDSDRLGDYTAVAIVEEEWENAAKYDYPCPSFPGISSDLACLIYTSGSTGRPKAVMSTHRNVVFAARAISECVNIRESDVIGAFLPMSFDYGLYQVFLTFQVGATLALGSNAHAGPLLIRKLIEWNVTGLPVVPSLAANIIRLAKRTPTQLPPLRFITNTGAHFPKACVNELRSLFPGCLVYIMFGLTECKRVSILSPLDYDRKPDSVGKPLPQTECLVVNQTNETVPAGQQGELIVRGPHVMRGYWRAPDLTAKRFRSWGSTSEIALFTGDMCSMDSEGFLYFHGRRDDIYKQGGFRVSALEVEAAACDIAGVRQAALLLPEEDVPAVLAVVGDLEVDEVFDELRSRLEDYKLPNFIIVENELPLTSNGKVDKKTLRTRLRRDRR